MRPKYLTAEDILARQSMRERRERIAAALLLLGAILGIALLVALRGRG